MNFERCCFLVKQNEHRLINKQRTLIFLHYHWDLLLWKRNKLKLGAIVFVIKEYKFDEVVMWEDIEIKFIRQDTTEEDDRKLEVLLKRLNWEWNMKNYIALGVVFFGFFIQIWTFLKFQYCKYLPTLAYRSEHYDFILKCGFESAFSFNSIGFFYQMSAMNYWLIDVIVDFCIYFNLIF